MLTIRIFCDICGREIPEVAEGEGEDVGTLKLTFGPFGCKPTTVHFDYDNLCLSCTNTLLFTIGPKINKLKKKKGE